jgi:hypothetical protein
VRPKGFDAVCTSQLHGTSSAQAQYPSPRRELLADPCSAQQKIHALRRPLLVGRVRLIQGPSEPQYLQNSPVDSPVEHPCLLVPRVCEGVGGCAAAC